MVRSVYIHLKLKGPLNLYILSGIIAEAQQMHLLLVDPVVLGRLP